MPDIMAMNCQKTFLTFYGLPTLPIHNSFGGTQNFDTEISSPDRVRKQENVRHYNVRAL